MNEIERISLLEKQVSELNSKVLSLQNQINKIIDVLYKTSFASIKI